MRLAAPAKINLYLRVGPPGRDGFHPLLSWMVTAGLFDTLTLKRRCVGGDDPSSQLFAMQTDHPSLPTDQRNLVTRVAAAMAEELAACAKGGSDASARLDAITAFLVKRIPAGAGLAGGSSDAATALMGLNHIWRAGWSTQRLSTFAARFGSDLSFFFHGRSSICTGRGEIVRPVAAPELARWAVLVLPGIEMPTPAVYRKFDEMGLGREKDILEAPDFEQWSSLSSEALLDRLVNDLEAPAFALNPAMGELRARLKQNFSRGVHMSGSGSSLFTLCDNFAQAELLARRARETEGISALAVEVAPGLPPTGGGESG